MGPVIDQQTLQAATDRKVNLVWASFTEMFGKKWPEKMGDDPLGASDEKNRNHSWCDALEKMQHKYVKQAIHKALLHMPTFDGWVPSLPEFMAFAGRASLDPVVAHVPKHPPMTWIEDVAISTMMRIFSEYPMMCEEDLTKVLTSFNTRVKAYELLRDAKEFPEHWTQEANDELRTLLMRDYRRINPRPASEEERTRRFQANMPSNRFLPSPATSSSLGPGGTLMPAEW